MELKPCSRARQYMNNVTFTFGGSMPTDSIPKMKWSAIRDRDTFSLHPGSRMHSRHMVQSRGRATFNENVVILKFYYFCHCWRRNAPWWLAFIGIEAGCLCGNSCQHHGPEAQGLMAPARTPKKLELFIHANCGAPIEFGGRRTTCLWMHVYHESE